MKKPPCLGRYQVHADDPMAAQHGHAIGEPRDKRHLAQVPGRPFGPQFRQKGQGFGKDQAARLGSARGVAANPWPAVPSRPGSGCGPSRRHGPTAPPRKVGASRRSCRRCPAPRRSCGQAGRIPSRLRPGAGGGVHQSARVRRPWLRWAWVTFSIMPFGGVVSDPLAAGAIPARSWARPIPARTRIIPLPPGVVRNGDPFKVLDVAVLWLEALEPGTGRSGRLYPDGDPGRSRRCPTHARAWPAGRRCGSRTGGAAPSARSGRTAGQGGRGDRSAPRRPHRPRAPSRDRSGDARSGPPAAPSGASRG